MSFQDICHHKGDLDEAIDCRRRCVCGHTCTQHFGRPLEFPCIMVDCDCDNFKSYSWLETSGG